MDDDTYFKAKALCSYRLCEECGDWRVGDRCSWSNGQGEAVNATIRWIGFVNGEESVGLELDAYLGNGDGTYKGVQLFKTRPNHAVMDDVDSISFEKRIVSCTDVQSKQSESKQNTGRTINASTLTDKSRTSEAKEKENQPTKSLDEAEGWRVGDRCVWRHEVSTYEATIKWIGKLEGHSSLYVGLELDTEAGTGTGMYMGVQLFKTKPYHAVIDLLTRIFIHGDKRPKFCEMQREKEENGKIAELSDRLDRPRVTTMESKENNSISESAECRVGDRCEWTDEGKSCNGTVKWIGRMAGRSAVYAGIEFDDPVGDGTGMHQGKELFKTAPGHAGFMLLSTISPFIVPQRPLPLEEPPEAVETDERREDSRTRRQMQDVSRQVVTQPKSRANGMNGRSGLENFAKPKGSTVSSSRPATSTDDDFIVHYEATDGSTRECTQQNAQLWLYTGEFTSDMRFAVVKKGTEVREDGEWKTLTELISLNGRAMPFLPSYESEEERKEEMEELRRLKEELYVLRERRDIVIISMRKVEERRGAVQREIEQLAHALNAPVTSPRNGQANTVQNTVVGEGNTEEAVSPILPKTGVDPFALLRCCTGAKRKMQGDFVTRFKQLRICFDRCDKKLLVLRTLRVFREHHIRMCQLCKVKIDSTNNVMEHICSGKHIMAMAGSVCEDAFDFWWSTVQEVTAQKQPFAVGSSAPVPAPFRLSGDRVAPRVNTDSRSVEGVTPPANNLALTVLRRTSGRVERPCAPYKQVAARLFKALQNCDKKLLDNDPTTRSFFVKPLLCLICNRCAIDKASNLITHIAGTGHVDKIVTENILISQEAIEFWSRAITRATK